MIVIDPVQRHLFFEGIFLRYGYDFRQYSEASLNRRLAALLTERHSGNLLGILQEVLESSENFRDVLPALTVHTSEFFRDPKFYAALREKILPVLKTYPSVRIWSAGCSTGEEVISLSILLEEEGLADRATIYATDISPKMIKRAKEGIFDMNAMKNFAKNYAAACGLKTPSDYYSADYGLVRFSPRLLARVVFSEHNLVTDSAFMEAHLIVCRNVMIYFNRELQNRVLELFRRSLAHRGFLGLGSKETVRFSSSAPYFEAISPKENIYRGRAAQ